MAPFGAPACPPCDAQGLPASLQQALLRTMLRIRRFETQIMEVYPDQEMQTPVHLCIGQEAIAAGICASMLPGDSLTTTHRSHGHLLARGASPKSLYAECYGKETGVCRGRGGSMHLAAPDLGVLGTTAIVGGGIPIATGQALAISMQTREAVSVCFFGDGASEEGTFQESLNFAALHQLPVVYICENNFYATSSPQWARQPHPDIHKRAESLGVPGTLLDGNDVFALYRAGRQAMATARKSGGPSLIECRTYRWQGHVGPDCDWEKGCRPKKELDTWQARCPLDACRDALLRNGVITQSWLDETTAAIQDEMEAAIEYAKASPFPDPASLTKHVFAQAADFPKERP